MSESQTPLNITTETRLVKVADIKRNPKNVKIHPKYQIEQLVTSIKTYSKEPKLSQKIVCDENMVALIGNGRLEAITELGWQEVEIDVITGLTEEQKKAYAILDNKSISVTWDEHLLAAQLPKLADSALETGFSEKEIKDLLTKISKEGMVQDEEKVMYDMTPRLYEKYNYILFFFKNELDFLYVQQRLGLKKMKDRMKQDKVGLFRGVDGMEGIKKIESTMKKEE